MNALQRHAVLIMALGLGALCLAGYLSNRGPARGRMQALADAAIPSVSFSADESTVTVSNYAQRVDSYGQHTWTPTTRTFPRPLLAAHPSPTGVVWWVSPTGSDLASGATVTAPLATIARALYLAAAGECIYLTPGVYSEVVVTTKPVTLSCAPGCLGKVKLVRPAADVLANPWRSVVTVQGSNTWVNGLVLQGAVGMPGAPTGTADSLNACGVFLPNVPGDTGCKVTNCSIYGNTHCGIKGVGYATIEGNVLFSNGIGTRDHGCYLTQPYNRVSGNLFLDNYGAGVHLYSGTASPLSPDYATVKRNVSIGHVQNILLAGAYCAVQQNTCSGGYAGIMYYNAGCHDNAVSGNICAFNSTFDCVNSGPAGANQDSGNCYYGAQSGIDGVTVTNAVRYDPKFLAPASGDYRTAAGSPAAGLGAYGEQVTVLDGTMTGSDGKPRKFKGRFQVSP